MRSNQNPSGSVTRRVGDRGIGERDVEQTNIEQPQIEQRNVGQRSLVAKLNMPQMPVEWLDSGSWRLPSGKALAEFAFEAGFLAPLLFRADRSGDIAGSPNRNVASTRGKQFGKGDGR
jgi:hypothetical protein